jgi:hypothetical protein
MESAVNKIFIICILGKLLLATLRTAFDQILSIKPLSHSKRDLSFNVSFTPNFEKIVQSLNSKL